MPTDSREGIVARNLQPGCKPSMPVEVLSGIIPVQRVKIDAVQAVEAGVADQCLNQTIAQSTPSPALGGEGGGLCLCVGPQAKGIIQCCMLAASMQRVSAWLPPTSPAPALPG